MGCISMSFRVVSLWAGPPIHLVQRETKHVFFLGMSGRIHFVNSGTIPSTFSIFFFLWFHVSISCHKLNGRPLLILHQWFLFVITGVATLSSLGRSIICVFHMWLLMVGLVRWSTAMERRQGSSTGKCRGQLSTDRAGGGLESKFGFFHDRCNMIVNIRPALLLLLQFVSKKSF